MIQMLLSQAVFMTQAVAEKLVVLIFGGRRGCLLQKC